MIAAKLHLAGIIAFCAASAFAQSAPNDPVKLEINLKPGQTRTFKIVSDTTVASGLVGTTPRKSVNHSSGTFELIADSVNPDGSYAIRVRTIAQSLTVDGSAVQAPTGSDAEVKATLGRDGRYREVSGAPKPSDGSPSPMTGEDFLSTIFDDEASLPSHALTVGETWKDKVESPVDPSQPKLTLNNALVSVDRYDTTPAARVLRIICEPLPNATTEPGVSTNGKMEGGGLSTIELASGLVLDERDVLRLAMNILAQNPADSSQRVSLNSEVNISVRIQAQPAS